MNTYKRKLCPVFNHLIRDYIEIKYTDDHQEQQEILDRLFVENKDGTYEINVIDGFVLNDTLLIIKDFNCRSINNLYILDKKTKEKIFIEQIQVAQESV